MPELPQIKGDRLGQPSRWLNSRREKTAVALLLLTTFALAVGSAAQKSVTVDEYQALPHGLAIWKTGDLHLATGVPVLPSVLPALPLVATDARLDTSSMREYTSSWQCGRQFVVDNAFDRDAQTGHYLPSGRYHDYFLLGRLTSIAILLLTCALAWGFARSLYGRPAGLLALAAACFSPNLLAHGRLVTPDIYLAAATISSLWAFDRLLGAPNWTRAAGLGVCLGLAALCKLTGLLLFVLLPSCVVLFWAFDFYAQRRLQRSAIDETATPARRHWPFLVVAIAVGLLTVNAGYLFDGTGTALGHFTFKSQAMQRLAAVLPASLPIPLPRYFFQGIDTQLAESGYKAYLMGKFNTTGFYSYYVVAWLVKTPVPVMVLCALAWFCRGWPTRREMPLLITAALLLLFFSLSRHKNIGVRYVLFLEPMMAVWIGRIFREAPTPAESAAHANATQLAATTGGKMQNAKWTSASAGWISVAAVACLAAITLSTWPHYLPYFNWLSGGPDHGHYWLLDSNLDWGQDLVALRRYQEQEQIDVIDLAHFGRVPPDVYGIRYRTLRVGERPQNRFVAISANLLWGLMYIVNGDLNYWPDDPDGYRAFRDLRPKAILGHSIYVFESDESPNGRLNDGR